MNINKEDIKEVIKQLYDLNITDWMWIFKIFRENIKRIFGSKYVVLSNNWTAWLYLAYKSIWLKEGDEVISSNYTYHATNSTLLNFTKNIKLCDVDTNIIISIKNIYKIISNKTKLLVIPHTWWLCPNMQDIMKLKDKFKNLIIIEDCSQAHFAKYKNKYLWTFWDIWVFSMQWWKLLTAWEWWFILTNNKEFYEKMVINSDSWKTIENLLEQDSKYLKYKETWLWLKFRANPIWIAFANSQLKTIKEKISNRIYYTKLIKYELRNHDISFPEIKNHYNTYYWLIWTYNGKKNFKSIINKLRKEWIDDIYNPKNNKPNHLIPLFSYLKKDKFKNSENIFNNLLYFNIFSELGKEEYILKYINKFKNIICQI